MSDIVQLTPSAEGSGAAYELGYDLDRTYWGLGYMTEAARAVVGCEFTTLNLHRIFAECHPANAASMRIMQKLGTIYEGHLRENVWVKGNWWDTIIYAILEHEWQARTCSTNTHRK